MEWKAFLQTMFLSIFFWEVYMPPLQRLVLKLSSFRKLPEMSMIDTYAVFCDFLLKIFGIHLAQNLWQPSLCASLWKLLKTKRELLNFSQFINDNAWSSSSLLMVNVLKPNPPFMGSNFSAYIASIQFTQLRKNFNELVCRQQYLYYWPLFTTCAIFRNPGKDFKFGGGVDRPLRYQDGWFRPLLLHKKK